MKEKDKKRNPPLKNEGQGSWSVEDTFLLKEDNINVSNGYGRGTITDAIQHALQKVGIPKTFAGIGARLIVFVLF